MHRKYQRRLHKSGIWCLYSFLQMFWISTKHQVPCLVLEAQGESYTWSHYSWGLNTALTLCLQFRRHLLAYLISSSPLCQTHSLGYLNTLHNIALIHMLMSWTHWKPELYAILLLNAQSWENMSAPGSILYGANWRKGTSWPRQESVSVPKAKGAPGL